MGPLVGRRDTGPSPRRWQREHQFPYGFLSVSPWVTYRPGTASAVVTAAGMIHMVEQDEVTAGTERRDAGTRWSRAR